MRGSKGLPKLSPLYKTNSKEFKGFVLSRLNYSKILKNLSSFF